MTEPPAAESESSSTAAEESTPSVFATELGSQPPIGFWDPLGLVADGDVEKFNRLRTVELKHGRVSMLAVVGHCVTTAGVRLPGNIDLQGTSFKSIGTGLKHVTEVPALGLAQILLLAGLLELFVMKEEVEGGVKGEFIGDFRNGAIDYGWDDFVSNLNKAPGVARTRTRLA